MRFATSVGRRRRVVIVPFATSEGRGVEGIRTNKIDLCIKVEQIPPDAFNISFVFFKAIAEILDSSTTQLQAQ